MRSMMTTKSSTVRRSMTPRPEQASEEKGNWCVSLPAACTRLPLHGVYSLLRYSACGCRLLIFEAWRLCLRKLAVYACMRAEFAHVYSPQHRQERRLSLQGQMQASVHGCNTVPTHLRTHTAICYTPCVRTVALLGKVLCIINTIAPQTHAVICTLTMLCIMTSSWLNYYSLSPSRRCMMIFSRFGWRFWSRWRLGQNREPVQPNK